MGYPKLSGTISYDNEVVAYCVKNKADKAEKLVNRAEKYSRARKFLEEILDEDKVDDERMKGRMEEFLDN